MARVSDWLFGLLFGEQERRAAQRHAEIIKALNAITKQGVTMTQEVDDLQAAVAAEGTVIDSAITLLNGLSARIADLAEDPVALKALSVEVKAKSDALAAAVVANTPAEPAPPEGAPV